MGRSQPVRQCTGTVQTVQLASSQLVPGYDSDGNLLDDAGINTGTSGDRNFIWDAENRLIEVKDESDGTTIATYAYDYLGRRVRKTVPGTGGEDTVFLYDGWNVIAEYQLKTENWELKTSYTWGMDLSGSMQGAGGVGGLLAVNDGTNTFYPTYDGNGNVSEYLNASGTNIAHYEYDAFGNIVKATGNSEDFRYRFSTKPLDVEIGWYYYGYRYYDPLTGRWPSRNPIGEYGGLNLYSFVKNNGINSFDMLGLQEKDKVIIPALSECHEDEASCKEACNAHNTRISDYVAKMRQLDQLLRSRAATDLEAELAKLREQLLADCDKIEDPQQRDSCRIFAKARVAAAYGLLRSGELSLAVGAALKRVFDEKQLSSAHKSCLERCAKRTPCEKDAKQSPAHPLLRTSATKCHHSINPLQISGNGLPGEDLIDIILGLGGK